MALFSSIFCIQSFTVNPPMKRSFEVDMRSFLNRYRAHLKADEKVFFDITSRIDLEARSNTAVNFELP